MSLTARTCFQPRVPTESVVKKRVAREQAEDAVRITTLPVF